MERLPVFKALGDNTRYAIYLELARSAVPLSTADLADALALHPNTVRPHLERMRDVGLLVVETDGQGQVGRPQHRYSVAPDAPSLGLEPSAFRLLATLVCDVATGAGMAADAIAAVGRSYGESLDGSSVDALTELGFDPVVATDGDVMTVAFTRCPFRELAEAYPGIVCQLHRGIVEGVAAARGEGPVTRFATLEDRNPCEVDLLCG